MGLVAVVSPNSEGMGERSVKLRCGFQQREGAAGGAVSSTWYRGMRDGTDPVPSACKVGQLLSHICVL